MDLSAEEAGRIQDSPLLLLPDTLLHHTAVVVAAAEAAVALHTPHTPDYTPEREYGTDEAYATVDEKVDGTSDDVGGDDDGEERKGYCLGTE